MGGCAQHNASVIIGLDALSFFVSSAFWGRIQLDEEPPPQSHQQEGVWASIRINQISLLQAVTPAPMLGRVNATMRFVIAVLIPPGALAGGLLGDQIGLRNTLLIAVAGEFAGIFWFVFSSKKKTQTGENMNKY